MNTANDAGHLTKDEIRYIEQVAKRTPDLDLTFSQVFQPLLLGNPHAETGEYRILTDTGVASLVRRGSRFKKLKINGTKVTYSVDEVGIEYGIQKSDIATARTIGRPLNVEYVERAKRATDEKINILCYRGDTEFGEFPGILELSGSTSYSGTALNTASLNIVNEVINGYQAIPKNFRTRKYTLVLADKEWKVMQKIVDNSSNASIKDLIMRNIPGLNIVCEAEYDAGNELSDGSTIVAGTASLIPNDRELVRLPVAKPTGNIIDSNSQSNAYEKELRGRVEGRLGPISVPFPTAVVKVTGW